MKKQYFVVYSDFANNYALFYAETPADVAALPAGAERITRRKAVALCERERRARKENGLALKYPYAEITEIVRAEEEKPEDTVQPFKVGESFNVRGETYTIIKATAKTVTYRSETGEVTRTTPKRQPKQDGSGEQWRIAVGSGWRCEYFYRT